MQILYGKNLHNLHKYDIIKLYSTRTSRKGGKMMKRVMMQRRDKMLRRRYAAMQNENVKLRKELAESEEFIGGLSPHVIMTQTTTEYLFRFSPGRVV